MQISELLQFSATAEFLLLMVLFIVGLRKYSLILTILRTQHASVWRELGRPSLVANNSMENGIVMLSFLLKRRFMDLSDSSFESVCNAYISFLKIYIVLFILNVITVIALIRA